MLMVCEPVVFRSTEGKILMTLPTEYIDIFLFCAEAPGGKDETPAAKTRTNRSKKDTRRKR